MMQHIRFTGEDIKSGENLIQDGIELNFAQITLLASQGITHIKVYRKPKVIVFSSGEELKLHPDRIVDIVVQALKPVTQHYKIKIFV
mgnify:CR=1 FL=1